MNADIRTLSAYFGRGSLVEYVVMRSLGINVKRRLSSILVPGFKLILLVVVAVGGFSFIRALPNVDIIAFLFFAAWCAIWYGGTFHWKSVYLEGDFLSVSNYLKKIRVPLSNVDLVESSSSWGPSPSTIKLYLKSPSYFGERIVFVPRLGGFAAGEMADELRTLIARHKTSLR